MSGPGLRFLVSGATGVVGDGLIAALLAADQRAEIVCLVRSHQAEAEVRARQRCGSRLLFVRCDLAKEGSVAEAVAAIPAIGRCVGVHCAADVAWDKSLEEMRALNIDGSLRFARILEACSADPRMIYVSSAYTAMEDWVYRNAYEESKAEAERRLRAGHPNLPVSTFSCSLVIGHSETGAIHRFHGIFPLIRFLALVRPPFLVGRPDCLIDLVPVDWVCAELCAIVLHAVDAERSDTVVAAAGPSRLPALRMIAIIEERIGSHLDGLGIPRRAHPIDVLPARRWAFLRRSIERWQPPGLTVRDFRVFDKIQSIYGPYTESDAVLPPCGLRSPVPDPERALAATTDHWLSLNAAAVATRHARSSGAAARRLAPQTSGV